MSFKSNRFFRGLTAIDLCLAKGFASRGVDAGRANREIRRRAAVAGIAPLVWMEGIIRGVTPRGASDLSANVNLRHP